MDLAAAIARKCAAGAVADRVAMREARALRGGMATRSVEARNMKTATAIETTEVPDTCATPAATVRDAVRPARGRMQSRAGGAVLVRLGRAVDGLTLVVEESAAVGLTLVAGESAVDGLTLAAEESAAGGLRWIAVGAERDGELRVVFAEVREVVRKADSRVADAKALAVRDTAPLGRGRAWRTAEVMAVAPKESRVVVAVAVKDGGQPCGAADSADRRAVVRT